MATATQKYFIHRLTASKPDWYGAIIYAKGVEPFGVVAGKSDIRYEKESQMIIVEMKAIDNPFDPFTPAKRYGPNPQDVTEANPGSKVDSQVHMHEDEIVRIEFLTNLVKNKLPDMKVTSTLSGVTDEIEEKDKEELIRKDREKQGLKPV